METKLITYFNIKGGIYKTSMSIITAYELAKDKNKKILLWDLDLQENLTQYLYKVNHEDKTTIDIVDGLSAEEVIVKSPNPNYTNIDIIPSDIGLAMLDEKISLQPAREKVLARWYMKNIDVLETYDYIICDLSPSYNLTAKNILYLADSIIVPIMDKNISSLRGAALFKELWTRDKYYLEKENNDIKATVLVGYEKQRTQISDLFDQYLQKFDELKDLMIDSFIRRSTFIEKSLLSKLSVGDYLNKNNQTHFSKEEIENMIEELKAKDVL
ncbi:Soj protein [[Clostridium] sordellii]|uniref:ParA family protein n=1 Tax=Paraclostridium sordellii TaxID=1505 RepID=UPI0005DAD776|nr:ParA family protein [Paeniclostridium sordellii]CEN30906.1 Soj protein [[Clostridium] sordellii] [Paeniclostridium sordellii]